MVWSTNYEKLSVATMFTLFWAGSVFAPKCVVNGMNVQDYLQQHYIGAMSAVAKAIHDAEGLEGVVVLGWDTMNEPGRGYIGQPDLNKFFLDTDMRKDLSPTPFEGMQLGVGLKTKVERWDVGGFGPKKSGTEVVEPFGASAWMTQEERDQADDVFGWTRDPAWTPGCIWELHGVWQSSDRKLLRPDYFYRDVRGQGRKRDPAQTYEFSQFFVPWVEGYVRQIQQIHSAGIVFIQPPVLTIPPPLPNDLKNIAYSPHFYDGLTLINKEWKNFNVDVIGLKRGKYGSGPLKYVRAVKIGEKAIRRSFVEQLGMIRDEAKEKWGDVPVVIGEIGIPYDMKGSPATASVWLKEAYRGILRPLSMCLDGSRATSTNSPGSINTTDSPQSKAMDANINALESNLLNYTLWNYVPDNVPIWGDRWNGEDLSIWQKLGAVEGSQLTTSRDSLLTATERGNTVESINARDIPAIHRPFARVVPGYAIRSSFVLTPAPVYELSFSMPADGIRGVRSKAPAEIYIPKYHFSKVVIDEFGELPPSSRPTQGKHSKIASVEFSDELDTLSEYEIDPKQDWDISTLLLEEKVLTRVTLSSGSWQRIEEGEHYWVLAWNVLADETSPRKEHSLHIDRVVVEQGGRIVSEGALLARNKPFCTIM
ncbi:hypothetical protein BZG36_05511 [Bifiguratus adelaidae]|uniref:Glycoside hydrolase family 5 C-terminal domain-containing protein n=1 Tax=Bifiguratus adelaidae TaxID=1938954 RepID=A0A261XTI5_9FUNG|nr:hypothetical protein BZG36_05511 [Bifiguratus adelaidae]